MFEIFLKQLTENLSKIKAEWDNNTFKVIVSSSAIDRSGEVIKQEWIDIKEYMKNPVVLVNHDYRVESIVWKATKVWKEWEKTYAEWVFSQVNPKAQMIQAMYNEWMIKAVSIWFIPYERKDWDTIVKSSMLEFSFVAVPCNPEALSTEWKELMKKGIESGLIKEEKKVEEISLKDIMKEINIIQNSLTDDKGEKKELEKEISDLKKEKEILTKEIEEFKTKKSKIQNLDKLIWEQLSNLKFELK